MDLGVSLPTYAPEVAPETIVQFARLIRVAA